MSKHSPRMLITVQLFFQLSFGDFSKEEFDIYLSGQSCVEVGSLFMFVLSLSLSLTSHLVVLTEEGGEDASEFTFSTLLSHRHSMLLASAVFLYPTERST